MYGLTAPNGIDSDQDAITRKLGHVHVHGISISKSFFIHKRFELNHHIELESLYMCDKWSLLTLSPQHAVHFC